VKDTQIIMGMPITVAIIDRATDEDLAGVFDYFRKVDRRYSPYKKSSELSKINNGLPESKWSDEMKAVLALCEQTKQETGGYFEINHHGKLDPSGLVKGWAIGRAAGQLAARGFRNFYIEAGGDIQAQGRPEPGKQWQVGIRNPFNTEEIVKVVELGSEGIATSGTYIRGEHIYNPNQSHQAVTKLRSLTVIGPNVYDADRFATAAFAMGPAGMHFIDGLPGFEAYMIDDRRLATYTKGFETYVVAAA
jgi:thiamine biosynthesis lipoprotein